jgi:tetratricopeptide (TPR) repeat protein
MLGEHREARSDFERAFEIQPYNPGRWHDYGRLLEDMGELPAAIRAHATSLRQGPRDTYVYARLLPLLRNAEESLDILELGELLDVLEGVQGRPREDARTLETMALLRLVLPDRRDLARAREFAESAVEASDGDLECLATLERVERELESTHGSR